MELDPVSRKVVRAFDVKGKAPDIVVLGPRSEFVYTSDDNSGTISAIRLATGDVKVIPAEKRPQGRFSRRKENFSTSRSKTTT